MKIQNLAAGREGWFSNAAPGAGAAQLVSTVAAAAAESYMQEDDAYAFHRALPYVGHDRLEFSYPKWDKDQRFQVRLSDQAEGAALVSVEQDVETVTDRMTVKAAMAAVTDEAEANNTTGRSLVEENTRLLMEAYFNTYEEQFANDIFNSATGLSQEANANWSAANFDIIGAVDGAREAIVAQGGREAELIGVCNDKVANLLRRNTAIRSAARWGTERGEPRAPMRAVAQSIGLRDIVVGSALSSTGNRFLGDHFVVMQAPAVKTALRPAAAFMVGWTGIDGSVPRGVAVRAYRNDEHGEDRVYVKCALKMQIQAAGLGRRFPTVTA